MQDIKELLDYKKVIKKRKPTFVRQEYTKRKKLYKKWRRPRGIHSKLRLRRKGKPARVAVGYRSPRKVRNLTFEGLKKVLVLNMPKLDSINKNEEIVVISGKVGDKKKLEMLKKCKEKNFKVFNHPKIDESIKKIEEKHKKENKAKSKKKDKERAKKDVQKTESKDSSEKESIETKEVKNESETPKETSK